MFFKFNDCIFKANSISNVFVSGNKLYIGTSDGSLYESAEYQQPYNAKKDVGLIYMALLKKIPLNLDSQNWRKQLLDKLSIEEIDEVIKGVESNGSSNSGD